MMKPLFKAVLLVMVMLAMSRPAMALEPFTGTLGAKFAADSVFGRFDDSINNGFDRFDNSGRLIRGHVEAILQSASAELADAMTLFFHEMTAQQKTAAAAYFAALQETENSYRRALASGSGFVLDTAQLVATLSPLGSSPVVIGMTTLEPLYDDTVGVITVVVTGINIGDSRNSAYGPDGQATTANVRDNRIEFDISVDMTAREDEDVPVTIEIFDKGILRSDVRRLPLTLRAIPNLIGEVAATYTIDAFPPRTRSVPPEGTDPYKMKCTGGGRSRCKNDFNQNILPSDGYQIVEDSIKVVATFSNRCASKKGFRKEPRNVSSNGFLMHVFARSSRGKSCEITVRAIFEEIPRSAVQERRETEYKPFRLSKGGISFEIPQGATHTGYLLRETGSDEIIPLAANSPLRRTRTVWSPDTTAVEMISAN